MLPSIGISPPKQEFNLSISLTLFNKMGFVPFGESKKAGTFCTIKLTEDIQFFGCYKRKWNDMLLLKTLIPQVIPMNVLHEMEEGPSDNKSIKLDFSVMFIIISLLVYFNCLKIFFKCLSTSIEVIVFSSQAFTVIFGS